MEIKKLVILSVFFLLPQVSVGYSVDTHRALTQETVRAYEAIYGNVFTRAEEQLIIAGSEDEDHHTRPLNHFYDPISGLGLQTSKWFGIRRVSAGDPSPQWATDTHAQASWEGGGIRDTDTLYSNETDFSWDRGVYEYVHNERERALTTLGHSLHLLQDATVPAHVRNDAHLTLGGEGDLDPYESYTEQFVPATIADIRVNNSEVPRHGSIAEYIKRLATYTNKNFLSKDTIFKGYKYPKKSDLIGRGDFLYSSNGIRRVVFREVIGGSFGSVKYQYSLEADTLQKDYWDTLSHEAVRYGVGAVNLFMHDAQAEAATFALYDANTSQSERDFEENIRKPAFAAIKQLYGSSLTESDVQELNTEVHVSQAADFAPPKVQNETPAPVRKPADTDLPTIIQGTEDGNIIITPEQQRARQEQMSNALLALESLLDAWLSTLTATDICNGIDISILKYSTCIAPFDEGGYGYGAGGGPGGIGPTPPPPPLPIVVF
jgi:hypothetical protein